MFQDEEENIEKVSHYERQHSNDHAFCYDNEDKGENGGRFINYLTLLTIICNIRCYS